MLIGDDRAEVDGLVHLRQSCVEAFWEQKKKAQAANARFCLFLERQRKISRRTDNRCCGRIERVIPNAPLPQARMIKLFYNMAALGCLD
jgi:hypothetical protein